MSQAFPRGLRRPSWPALAWLGVLVIALVLGVVLAGSSDAGNTDVRTATDLPASSSGPLPGRVSPLWAVDAAVDDQQSVASGTVITSNEHGVRGLDPLTGDERWHYLRPNASVCDLTVLDDVVVAIFKTTGRCNEAVALEAGTGVRRWYRNVDFSDELSMLGSGTAALAATPGGIAVLDAVGNSIRWGYNPPEGCELSSIGIGVSGVVVLERCTSGTTWLAEFALESGDQQWRVAPPPGEVTVLGADGVVSLLVGQQLTTLSARDGSLLSTVTTAPESDGSSESAATLSAGPPGGQGVPLVYLAGQLYAIEPAGGAQLWSVAATGLPANGDSAVVVPEAGAFVTRNLVTGEEIARSPIGDASGSQEGGLEGLVRVELAGSVLIAVTQNGLVSYG